MTLLTNHFTQGLSLLFIPLYFCLVPSEAFAQNPQTESYAIEFENGTRVAASVHRGDPSQATFVLLNGSIYDVERWSPLAEELIQRGFTVVRYSYSAQPESLKLLPEGQEPHFFKRGLDLTDLAGELKIILTTLEIHQPVHLVGLSYGASIASEFAVRYPEAVEATIFLSPLVIPLDNYDLGGSAMRIWLGAVRFWENAPCDLYGTLNPWLCQSRDYWYDAFYNQIYQSYLSQQVQGTPHGIDEAVFKKSVFHLVRAARDFDLRSYTPSLKNVHMLLASGESAALTRDQNQAWRDVPEAEKRSYVVFNGAEHALPDTAPYQTSLVLTGIAQKQDEFTTGKRVDVPADR